LVCEPCRRRLTPHEKKKLTILLHEFVRDKSEDPLTGLCTCHHCEKPFPRDMICADHFPVTKGSDETKRFDLSDVVPSCGRCNTSGAAPRTRSFANLKGTTPSGGIKKDLCRKCRRMLKVYGDLCILCVNKNEARRPR
jgi:hypothetical protein